MSVSRYKYEDIVRIISEINELHYSFSIQLSNLLSFNLKNTISSVVANNSIDSDFQELVNSYKKELNSIVGGISDIQNKFVGIRYRIKQAESISEKLLYYMTDVHEFGKVPLNKCLNDLLGFRILVIDLESVYATLKHDDRVTSITKMYLRTDGGYSGIHLYFKMGIISSFLGNYRFGISNNRVQMKYRIENISKKENIYIYPKIIMKLS